MRRLGRWVTAVVFATVVAACAPAPPAPTLPPQPAERGLRVMTYNLLGAQADDRVVDEHAGWAARIDQLLPDVLVLQEAQSDDVAAVLNRTSAQYSLVSYRQWECDLKASPEGVAILVRSTVRILGGGGRHVGASCFDPTVRRVLVWADLDLDGQPFRVYGTHLTAGAGPSAASRDAQIRTVRRILVEDDPTASGRWVLAGDLNAPPGSPSYGLVLDGEASEADRRRLVDVVAELTPDAADPSVCPAVAAGDRDAMTWLLANPEHVRRCGFTAGWPKDDNWLACDLLSLCTSWEARRDSSVRVRIDNVLRPAGGPVEVISTHVPNRADADWAIPGAEWYRLSDHLPLVVDLEIVTTP